MGICEQQSGQKPSAGGCLLRTARARKPHGYSAALGLLFLAVSFLSGCTALTNPVADGIPVRLLPGELWGPSKAHLQPIPLSLLGQARPDAYRLDTGDVLGVYIDGFLGERLQGVPLHVAPLVD